MGAVENVKSIKRLFPGWISRFYVAPSVSPSTVERLVEVGEGRVEVVEMEEDVVVGRKGRYGGNFWRFLVASDPDVAMYAVRDVDARMNERDVVAMAEWEASGRAFHVIRDHPQHSRHWMWTMLWGGRRRLPSMEDLLQTADLDAFFADMHFLNGQVWPLIRDDVFIHDCWTCVSMGGICPNATRSPRGFHMGGVFDQHNVPRQGDIDLLLRAPQSPECLTHYHPLPPPSA